MGEELEGGCFYGRKKKTAAAQKLRCSTSMPQGCVFAFVSAYICVSVCIWKEQNWGQYRAEMEREGGGEGRDRQEDLVIFAW